MRLSNEREKPVILFFVINIQVVTGGSRHGAGKQIIRVKMLQIAPQVVDVKGNILRVFKNGGIYLLQDIAGLSFGRIDLPGVIDQTAAKGLYNIICGGKSVMG